MNMPLHPDNTVDFTATLFALVRTALNIMTEKSKVHFMLFLLAKIQCCRVECEYDQILNISISWLKLGGLIYFVYTRN